MMALIIIIFLYIIFIGLGNTNNQDVRSNDGLWAGGGICGVIKKIIRKGV